MTLARGRDLIPAAHHAGYGLPAFNVSNLETTQAIVAAASQAAAPVILQVSPGAIAYAGFGALTRLVRDAAESAAVPVLVHLDHCREMAVVQRAIESGYGSVMFDGSNLEPNENAERTAEVVSLARPHGIAVEGEIGEIGGRESTTLEAARAALTTPAEAAWFAGATGVDVLAAAVGTLHRMPDASIDLDLDVIAAIATAAACPLALHGASGIDPGQLRGAIGAGVVKVNISSRVSRALATGIRQTWAKDPDELDLRRFLGAGRAAVERLARSYFDATRATGHAGAAGPAAVAGESRTDVDSEPE
ncbi:MAG: ketose-bisphosphate aldolase [Chloroflexi bacterium]|nr:ketose-bisphosphate aldolase [Chloroflexota bacterium]